MKKVKNLIVAIIAVIALSMSSCHKDCDNVAQKVIDAGEKFSEDPSVEGCNEYKKTVQKFLDKCSWVGSAEAKAAIAEMDCSDYEIS